VLDSLGAGEAPDADDFGDSGASTLGSLHRTGLLKIDNLLSLGLGNIDGLGFLGTVSDPRGAYGKMREASMGKDTTIGHWEIAGHISDRPLPTFENGFPPELIADFSKKCGRGVLCNLPYSGTQVILDYGREHLESGDLIVYTSADSVFQIAAHVDIVPLEELYSICETARKMLVGEYSVGRVIARPFGGTYPNFERLPERRDFSLEPPALLLPEAVFNAGLDSISVGKISDIFADRKFTEATHTHSNKEGIELSIELTKKDFQGLCFVNLVDFDSKYGHRRNPEGYARALNEFDAMLPEIIAGMGDEDLLIITADHGCDPAFMATTDHTREYVPLIVYSKDILPDDLRIRDTFADIGASAKELLGIDYNCDGSPIPLRFKEAK